MAATYSLNMVYLTDSKHGVSDSVGFVTMHASSRAVPHGCAGRATVQGLRIFRASNLQSISSLEIAVILHRSTDSRLIDLRRSVTPSYLSPSLR